MESSKSVSSNPLSRGFVIEFVAVEGRETSSFSVGRFISGDRDRILIGEVFLPTLLSCASASALPSCVSRWLARLESYINKRTKEII
jgi:hypothetical protein